MRADREAGLTSQRYVGELTGVVDGSAVGWVRNVDHPERVVGVHAVVDGREVASGRADEPVADGYAFSVLLPQSVALAAGHRIAVAAGPHRVTLTPAASFASSANGSAFANTSFVAASPERRRAPGVPGLALAAAAIVFCGLLLFLTRDHILRGDDWAFAGARFQWWPSSFLRPVDGQPALATVLAFKLSLTAFGLHAWPLRVILLVSHLAVVALLWRLAARRVGDVPAAALAAVLLVFGAASPAFLSPAQIGMSIALALGIGALLLLESPSPRATPWACLLLVLAGLSSVAGVVVVLAVTVELVRQRRVYSRLWVAAIPIVVLVVWYLAYGAGQFPVDGVLGAPAALVAGGSATLGGLLGVDATTGRVVLVGAALGVGWVLTRGGGLTSVGLVGVVGFVLTWVVFALEHDFGGGGRTHALYVSGTFALVALAGQLRPSGERALPLAAVAAVLVFVALSGYSSLVDAAAVRDRDDRSLALALGALDSSGDRVVPSRPVSGRLAGGLTTGRYRAAQARYGGGFGAGERELRALSARRRALLVDRRIIAFAGVRLTRASVTSPRGARPPKVFAVVGALGVPGAHCTRFSPGVGRRVTVDVEGRPGRRLLVAAAPLGGARVFVRRFADGFDAGALGPVTTKTSPAAVAFPSGTPAWRVRVSGVGALQLCDAPLVERG